MKKPILFLILLSAIAASCSAGRQTDPTSVPITDPDIVLSVKTGAEIKYSVEANPTTGYHWEIVGDLVNVELVSREYKQDQPVAPGSGGLEVWTFKAILPGQTTITLGYYPPSNDPTEPQQTVTFTVNIK